MTDLDLATDRDEIRAVIADSIRECAPDWNDASIETMASAVLVGMMKHFGPLRIHRAQGGGALRILRDGLPLPAGQYRRLSSDWVHDGPLAAPPPERPAS